jgi:hypothetical protein
MGARHGPVSEAQLEEAAGAAHLTAGATAEPHLVEAREAMPGAPGKRAIAFHREHEIGSRGGPRHRRIGNRECDFHHGTSPF